MKRLAVAAVLATCLGMSACGGGDSSSSEEGGAIKLGVVGPETGPVPQYYIDQLRPAEMAIENLAEEYGVEVELVTADDQASPEGASQAVQRLLNEEQVDALLGPPLSGNALQVADVVQQTGRPWMTSTISPEVMDESLDPNWLFRTNYNAADLGVVGAQLLFANDATVGVVYSADAYGQSGLDSITAQAESLGAEVAASEAIQPGATDFNAGINRLKDAGVDTVYLAITAGADTSTVTNAIVQQELDPRLVVTNATILADFGTLADPSQWEDLVFIDPRDLVGADMAAFAKEYEEKYDEPPTVPTSAYANYLAVEGYLKAVAEVGDGSDYEGVRKAMEGLDSIAYGDDVYEAPFAAGDHELYEAEDPAGWLVFGFDKAGKLESRGDLVTCIESGC